MTTIEQSTSHDVRTVPLTSIAVVDGFNPRTTFEEAELRRLAASIREAGVLQPLIVYPTDQADRFELGDGERRYRAAQLAELTDVPVVVRAREQDRDAHELVEALTVNLHRADHTPMEEARAFKRLLDAGLTRKGITERLAVTRERVRERLQLLELPEDVQPAVDAGTVPLTAAKTLLELAAIHQGLPALAVAAVGRAPRHSWGEPVTWADVIEDPLGAVLPQYSDEPPDLPEGVYDADYPYPLACFELGDKGVRDLGKLAELEPEWADEPTIVFGRVAEVYAQAESLGAAHASPHGRSRLIVGQDVCDQLAADTVKRALKHARERARREADHRRQQAEAHGQDPVAAAADPEAARQQEEVRRQAEREEAKARKAQAERFNDELGAAVFKAFGSVKASADALKVLAAVDLTPSELSSLAGRGMRYGFPGWVTTEEARGGKTKRVYLVGPDVTAKVTEYLHGAEKPGEIVGRCLAVVVMAVLADEACVARSNRSFVSLAAYQDEYGFGHTVGLPWQTDTLRLVEDLAIERLPEHLTAPLRERRDEIALQKAAEEEAERALQAKTAELREQLPSMTAEQRMAAVDAYEEQHGRFGDDAMQLRRLVVDIIDADTVAAAAQAESPTADADADAAGEPGEDTVDKPRTDGADGADETDEGPGADVDVDDTQAAA